MVFRLEMQNSVTLARNLSIICICICFWPLYLYLFLCLCATLLNFHLLQALISPLANGRGRGWAVAAPIAPLLYLVMW